MNPTRVRVGDIVLGLESDGIHSNGYTLVRKVVESAGLDLNTVHPDLNEARRHGGTRARRGKKNGNEGAARTLGEVLLTPTRIYAGPIVKLQRNYRVKNVISGMAHITGSGLAGNLERALHKGVDARIDTTSWEPPPLFRFIQTRGGIDEAEMRRVFNMGIGYTLIVREAFAESVAEQLTRYGERVHQIGKIAEGSGRVIEE